MNYSKSIKTLYLSQEDIISTNFTLKDAIKCVEKALVEHAYRRVENPPKPGIHPKSDAFIHAMPAYLSSLGIAGMKWVSSFPSNINRNIPSVMGIIILNDIETGQPTVIMDCQWITAVRTGAVSAVAVKYLANKDSKTIGVVGAGIQGRYNLLAISEVLPSIELIKLFDINPPNLENTIQKVKDKISCKIVSVPTAKDAIEGSDIIITATGRLDSVIYLCSWVKEGSLILPIHHRGWENKIIHQSKFITDDWAQLSYAAQTIGGFDGPLPVPFAKLGEIVIGNKPGRETSTEIIIDFNYGLAIEDLVIANEIYMHAKQMKIGTYLPLISQNGL